MLETYAQRASQSLAGGQLDQAAKDFQQASQLDQTTADKLAPYLTEAQSGRPGPYSAIARGDHDEEDQNYEQAPIDYADAIKANPNLAVAYLGRAYAYRALDRFEDARADSSEAIRLDPNGWTGFYSRGQLYESMEQFDNAAADFDQASAIIEKAHDWAYKYEKEKIDDARKSLKFSSTLQEHWISYLKEIQAANTRQNWSDAPYDLYVKHHKFTECCQAEADTHDGANAPARGANARPLPTSSETSREPSLIQPWILSMVFGVLLLTGLALVWRYRWSHAKPLPLGPADSASLPGATPRARPELRGRLMEKGDHTEGAKVATTSSDSEASRLKGSLASRLKGTLAKRRS